MPTAADRAGCRSTHVACVLDLIAGRQAGDPRSRQLTWESMSGEAPAVVHRGPGTGHPPLVGPEVDVGHHVSRASGGGSESDALSPPIVSARAGSTLALQPHLPHEVALAKRHALHAQDVVRGRGVEVEVG